MIQFRNGNVRRIVIGVLVALLYCARAVPIYSQDAQDKRVDVNIQAIGGQPIVLRDSTNLPVDVKSAPLVKQWVGNNSTWETGVHNGDIVELVFKDDNHYPRQIVICGHGLNSVDGALHLNTTDDSFFFPLTLNGTATRIPNDGCFSVTPVGRLRIKGYGGLPANLKPSLQIVASY